MSIFKQKINPLKKPVLGYLCFAVCVLACSIGLHVARAAWEEPQAQAPGGNMYTPVNIGPAKQAKSGFLLLDPNYDPYGVLPAMTYPLEVRGLASFLNYLDVNGNMAIDTDTLFVNTASEQQVGIGTSTPTAKLDVVGGVVSVGKSGSAITGTAITTVTEASGGNGYGAYGSSQADGDVASVVGSSTNGVGVYGANTSSGAGVYGESTLGSGVVGMSTATYSTSPIVAAIYGASGPSGWAGYFAQRLYGTGQIIGRKFTPDRLQLSQVPYTAGWEARVVPESKILTLNHIAFDGQYIWTSQEGWDNTSLFVINPTTGVIAEEVDLISGGNVMRNVNKLLYINGDVWAAGFTNAWCGGVSAETITRINADPNDHTVTHYQVGDCHSGTGTAYDMVYDDVTGGPYIWVINRIRQGTYPNYTYSHSLSRFTIDDGTYTQFTLASSPTCLTLDPSRCNDGADNDGDGRVDRGCSYADGVLRWGIDTKEECDRIPGASWNGNDDSQCTNSAGSVPNPASDERLVSKAVGHPTGITFDGTSVWVSFDGMDAYGGEQQSISGEGLVKVDASDPNSSSVICIKDSTKEEQPGKKISDIDFDTSQNRLWMSYDSTGVSYNGGFGIGRFDPGVDLIDYELTNQTGNNWGDSPRQVLYDNQSGGNPYLWVGGWNFMQHLYKFRINDSDIYNSFVEHDYVEPSGLNDFTLDLTTSGGPYVWGAHTESNLISKNQINDPYEITTYIPKGANSGGSTFDGTYVWSTNSGGYSVSKFRASDGKKIGDYPTGRMPSPIIFDGNSIWTMNWYDPLQKDLTQIRATDGARLGDYDVSIPGGARDLLYDGKYIWATNGNGDSLKKIDPQSCSDGDDAGTGTGSCDYKDFALSGINPNKLVFDGRYLWVTARDNHLARILPTNTGNINNDTIVQENFTLPSINASEEYNVKTIKYDGTYIWIGTARADSNGSSVYKINPADCSSGTCTFAAQLAIYHESGKCSGGTRNNNYCSRDSDCTGGGTCANLYSNVTGMVFDGTNMWVYNGTANQDVSARECQDGIDNDGDGKIDLASDNRDRCVDADDMYESPATNECDDNVDNNGDGLCDYDGAIGSPGCSGKPDPGCSNANDRSEAVAVNDSHLTRIVAATNQIVESVRVANYSTTSGMVFDGTLINYTVSHATYLLHQFFSGSGLGQANPSGSVTLQNAYPGMVQPGSFSISGSATVGENLMVVGDIVATGNTWPGSDSDGNFGSGCADGQFVKGVTIDAGTPANNRVQCRGL